MEEELRGFELLPDELVDYIREELRSPLDLINFCNTNHRFKYLCDDEAFWRYRYEKDFDITLLLLTFPIGSRLIPSYKQLYLDMARDKWRLVKVVAPLELKEGRWGIKSRGDSLKYSIWINPRMNLEDFNQQIFTSLDSSSAEREGARTLNYSSPVLYDLAFINIISYMSSTKINYAQQIGELIEHLNSHQTNSEEFNLMIKTEFFNISLIEIYLEYGKWSIAEVKEELHKRGFSVEREPNARDTRGNPMSLKAQLVSRLINQTQYNNDRI